MYISKEALRPFWLSPLDIVMTVFLKAHCLAGKCFINYINKNVYTESNSRGESENKSISATLVIYTSDLFHSHSSYCSETNKILSVSWCQHVKNFLLFIYLSENFMEISTIYLVIYWWSVYLTSFLG